MFPVRPAVPFLVLAAAFLTTVATASAQFTPAPPAASDASPSLLSVPSFEAAVPPPLVPDPVPAAETYTPMVVRRDTTVDLPDGQSRRTVYEPSIGGQGNAILTTGNYQAQLSTNNGMSWRYINPATEFPTSPAAFAAGFCCDQRIAQDPARNLVFWYLQYRPTGEQSDSTNGVRIAVYRGAGALATGNSRLIEFTPADFGIPLGSWLDFPHMQVGATYLYFTSNVYTTTRNETGGFNFIASVIGRVPLDALASGAPYSLQSYKDTSINSIAPVNGAGATIYFASVASDTAMALLRWRDSDPQPTRLDIAGLAATYMSETDYTCPGPGGVDACQHNTFRAQTGWASGSEVGFM